MPLLSIHDGNDETAFVSYAKGCTAVFGKRLALNSPFDAADIFADDRMLSVGYLNDAGVFAMGMPVESAPHCEMFAVDRMRSVSYANGGIDAFGKRNRLMLSSYTGSSVSCFAAGKFTSETRRSKSPRAGGTRSNESWLDDGSGSTIVWRARIDR
jgi:hypothetical protein